MKLADINWYFPPGKYTFVEYLLNIPMIYSQNIRKKFPMKFRGILPNNASGILFVEHSRNIPMLYSRNIQKKLPMKFRAIFPHNVSGILNIGIFPDCSMNILQMLQAFYRWIKKYNKGCSWYLLSVLKIWYFHESLVSIRSLQIAVQQVIITVIIKICKVIIM